MEEVLKKLEVACKKIAGGILGLILGLTFIKYGIEGAILVGITTLLGYILGSYKFPKANLREKLVTWLKKDENKF